MNNMAETNAIAFKDVKYNSYFHGPASGSPAATDTLARFSPTDPFVVINTPI